MRLKCKDGQSLQTVLAVRLPKPYPPPRVFMCAGRASLRPLTHKVLPLILGTGSIVRPEITMLRVYLQTVHVFPDTQLPEGAERVGGRADVRACVWVGKHRTSNLLKI